jgi:mRNA-degrading endonuclease RelE of RelBE toxin-antitoxin system
MKTAPKRINQRKTRTLEPFRRKTTGQTPSSQTVFAGVQLGSFWRYRVGDYRIIAHIEDETVQILVLRIGNRKDVYR